MWKILFSFFVCCCCVSAFADCEDENVKEENQLSLERKPLFVSLGSSCEVAMELRRCSLRSVAFPFDWLLTLNHDLFIDLLNENFNHFLDKNSFSMHPGNSKIIENHLYQVEFRHDPPELVVGSLEEIYKHQLGEILSKYSRRIERFRELRNYPGKIFFIRAAYNFAGNENVCWGDFYSGKSQAVYTPTQIRELRKTLETYFPGVNFTLIIINHREEYPYEIMNIPGVIEFKVRLSHIAEDYASIFNHLKLNYSE